ncbi:hypothetical protein FRC10_007619 [Ceratobasidium sp. 414]|nr:hypothetical protein FRC10_007619 [Ceratobasidium sp. 414]
MASRAATDFLTKEIKISNNIVTFRLLSRQLSIHVNDAKRELELFHAASQRTKDPVFATYVLTGVAAPEVQSEAVPESVGASGHVLGETSRYLVTLVSEDELEDARGRFVGAPSQHVHSLSPVPLKVGHLVCPHSHSILTAQPQLQEPGLLTSVASRVRQLDTQKGQEHAAQIGMLLSREAPYMSSLMKPDQWSGTSKGKGKAKRNVDNSTKPKAPAASPPNKAANLERTASKVTASTVQVAKEPARQSALNFGGAPKKTGSPSSKMKAQAIAPKTKNTTDSKPVSKAKAPSDSETASATSKNTSPSSVKSVKSKSAQFPVTTTGRTKRILDFSEEDEPAPSQPRPALKRKKSRAASDDDDDDGSERQPVAARRRSASLQAMMDVDDDGVINGRSTRSPTPEHVPSAREVAAAAKAAKAEAKAVKAEALKGVDHKERASRKRVPKGKRRVIKTRRVKNAKGYMVSEDYSSYEDIDSDEPGKDDSDADTEPDQGEGVDKKPGARKATTTKSNAQKAGSATGLVKRRQSESSSGVKKAKQTTGKPGQQKLASFFGKK